MHAEDELTKAAATGDTCRVQLLLSNGANVNSVNRFGRTPIQVGYVFRHVLKDFILTTSLKKKKKKST